MIQAIVLATNNQGKLKEYREILSPIGCVVYSPKDLGLVSDPEETGANYRENAFLKAKALINKTTLPVLSDDSGLEINALGKFPGLHSARFASSFPNYAAAWEELNRRLEGKEDRSSQFVCCICLLLSGDAEPLYFEGVCPGRILKEPAGSNGFGYDPIFHSDEANADFGSASEELKNRFSHRGKAIAKLTEYLLG